MKTTLLANFETFVNEVENQEAIIDSCLLDIKQALSKIHVQSNRVERQLQRTRARAKDLTGQIQLWRSRAKQVKAENPVMAKDCLLKVLEFERESDQLIIKQQDLQNHLTQLMREKALIQDKFTQVELKKSSFIARESILNATHAVDSCVDLEGVFERWDDKLAIGELNTVSSNTVRETSENLDEIFQRKELESDLEQLFKSLED